MTRAPLRTLLVADTPTVVRDVRGALAGTSLVGTVTVRPFPQDALCPTELSDVDAVLVEWDLMRAPEIGAVSGWVRRAGVAVVALGEPRDHVPALAVGADRFLPLPVDPELLRVQIAAHRRARMPSPRPGVPSWAADRPAATGPVAIDWPRREARVGPSVLPLTPRQFDVLAYFVAADGELVSRDHVLEAVWGYSFETGTNLVDVYVHHLRRVLTKHGVARSFDAVRGRGYRFEPVGAAL